MPRARRIDLFALTALIGLSTYLLVGDFSVRLANTSSDDGLVAYAYFLRYPELFQKDAQILNWSLVAGASMLNWLPGALFKYLDVSPEACHWFALFLQNILLGLAVFRFGIVATGNREAAWLSALFTLAFRPHWWNIGLFADADWMPYAAWFALPFLVYAAAFALERKLAATALALLVGALVHPVLGLFASMMIGAYWSLLWLRERNARELLIRGAVLAGVVIVFMLPVLVIRSGIEEAPLAHILPMILNNGHAIPWEEAGCDFCFRFFLRNVPLTVMMTALALLAANRPHVRSFMVGCTLVALALCLLHIVGYLVGNVTILRLVTFRSTILLLIFAVPLVVALVWRHVGSGEPMVRLLAGYFLLLPSAAALLAVLLVLPAIDRFGNARSRMATLAMRFCQMLGAALFGLLLARHVPKLGPRVDIYLLERVLDPAFIPLYFGYQTVQFPWVSMLTVAFLCMVAAWHWRASRQRRAAVPAMFSPLVLALAAWIVFYLLAGNRELGQWSTTGEAREYYEVQVWARASTPPSASFIAAGTSTYDGWRNFTHRPKITPKTICGFYACSQAALAYDKRMTEFYARHGGGRGYTGLDTEGLREFARAFGGDYAVRRKGWAALALPVAFENASYVVYDVR